MIHSLTMKNWYKHHNRTFDFKAGLNLIRGENEGGKSLILEAIDYALHGSVALRLPVSMYPTNLGAILETSIRGTRYIIDRSPKMATLTIAETGEVIAKGTKPVDQEIKKLLGFNRNVFLVSNYSSQDAINHLSSLRPAERKKVIDNVVGLTAVEEVLTEHKLELTALNKVLAGYHARLPEYEPIKPSQDLPDYVANEKMYLREEMSRLSGFISKQENIVVTRQRLIETKPEQLHFDELRLRSMLIPEGVDRRAAAIHDATVKSKKDLLAKQQQQISSEKEPQILPKVDTKDLIEGITVEKVAAHNFKVDNLNSNLKACHEKLKALKTEKESTTYYTQSELDDIYLAQKLYSDWQEVNKLKEKGSLICDDCGASIPLMKEALAQYKHVPEVVPVPLKDYEKANKSSLRFGELNDAILELENKILGFEEELEATNSAWYPETVVDAHFETVRNLELWNQSVKVHDDYKFRIGSLKDSCATLESEIMELELNWYDSKVLEDNFYAIDQFELLEKQNASLLVWQRNFDALPEYAGDAAVAEAKVDLEKVREKEDQLLKLEAEWSEYTRSKEAYDSAIAVFQDAKTNVDAEKEIINTLQIYKQKIKSSILPSVNSVASSWLQRMSLGKHVSVALTDDMDILVNGEPIEALSISGRALGHLSLRMALGQVLTNSIYPVFMADEVDASMRNERAQAVLDNLVKMLDGSVKQIIMISHRELENVHNVIEV